MKSISLLLACILLLLQPAAAQMNTFKNSCDSLDYRMKLAGTDLINYHRQYQTGFALELGGTVMMMLGVGLNIGTTSSNSTASTTNNSTLRIGSGLIVVGVLSELCGVISVASASSHVRNAGFRLRGTSLVLPINKPKNNDHKKRGRDYSE